MPDSIIKHIRAAMSATDVALADTMALVRAEHIETDLEDRLRSAVNAVLRTLVSRRPVADDSDQPSRSEARAVVVVGEAGTGKSASLDHVFRTHPILGGYGRPGSDCPIARVVVPAPCSLKALGTAILHALDYPLARDLREHAIWTRVHETLRVSGKVILHLDEMHNLTDKANVLELDAIRKALKTLMVSREWPVGLVVSGLPSLVPALQEIDEVRRRGRFIHLPELSLPEDLDLVAVAIQRCSAVATLAVPEEFAQQIGPRLSHAGLNRYGIVIELIHGAIENCLLENKHTFDIQHFATAYADRTGCGDRMNPFIAPDWPDIDAAKVLLEEMPIEPALAGDPAPRRARKNGRSKS